MSNSYSGVICFMGVFLSEMIAELRPASNYTQHGLVAVLFGKSLGLLAWDADRNAVLKAYIAIIYIFMTYAAPCFIKGAFDGAELKIRFQLNFEQNLVRLLHGPLNNLIGDGVWNLGGFDPASSISKKLKSIHGVDEFRSQGISHRPFFRMVKNARQFTIVLLCHQNLSIRGACGDLYSIHHAGLRMSVTQLRKNEKIMILYSFGAKFQQCKPTHPIPNWHKRTPMSVEFICPVRRCKLCFHIILLPNTVIF